MIAYPRWKIILVAVVVVLGFLLALPNLFGEASALQLARDRAAVTPADRTAVEQLLKDKGVKVSPILDHDDSEFGVARELHPGVFVRSYYFQDPDGILLEFACWLRVMES